MSSINLSQDEADLLINEKKYCVESKKYLIQAYGGNLQIPLLSSNKKEIFILDINKAYVNLSKITYQNRVHNCIVLLRLDHGGHPHRNPDGKEVSSPHIHIYKEGYGDKWAYPLDDRKFSNTNDIKQILIDFMGYCNIIQTPNIEWELSL